MKFETVRIHFLSDVLLCCHPKILLPWQRDVTTSPLYWWCIACVFHIWWALVGYEELAEELEPIFWMNNKYRILQGRAEIWNFSSSVEKISRTSEKFFNTRKEISHLQAAMLCPIYFINTNEIPNHFSLIFFES